MRRQFKYKGDGWKRTHVRIAETALGKPLPLGAQVHHLNEDGTDNRNNNLVICEDLAYHRLLHVRTRIVRAGGDPDKERICGRCRRVKPFAEMSRARNEVRGICRQCCALAATLRRRASGIKSNTNQKCWKYANA